MLTEKLFSAIDETEYDYIWDCTTREVAVALFDVNDEYFAMITKRREIVFGLERPTYYVWNLYSKNNLKPAIKPVERLGTKQRYILENSNMVEVGKEDLMSEVKKKPYGTDIKELESITLELGRIYILDGNLIFDRIQP